MYGLGPFGGLPYGVVYTYVSSGGVETSQDVLLGHVQTLGQSSTVVQVVCSQNTETVLVQFDSIVNSISISTLSNIQINASDTLVECNAVAISKQQMQSVVDTDVVVESNVFYITEKHVIDTVYSDTTVNSTISTVILANTVSCVDVSEIVQGEQVSVILNTGTVLEQPIEVINAQTTVDVSGIVIFQGLGFNIVTVEEQVQSDLDSIKLSQSISNTLSQVIKQGQQVSLSYTQQVVTVPASTSVEGNTVTLVYGQGFEVSQGSTLTDGFVSTIPVRETVTVPSAKTVGNSPIGVVSGLQVVIVNAAQTKEEAPLAVSGMPQDIVISNVESLLKGVGVSVGSGYNIVAGYVEERLNVTTLAVLQEIELAMLFAEQATKSVIVEVELDLPDSQSISLVDVNQLNESVAVWVGSTVTVVSRPAEQYTSCLLVGTKIADLSKLRVTLLSPSFTIEQVTKKVNVRSSTKIIGINL